jgi:hypothetical protein
VPRWTHSDEHTFTVLSGQYLVVSRSILCLLAHRRYTHLIYLSNVNDMRTFGCGHATHVSSPLDLFFDALVQQAVSEMRANKQHPIISTSLNMHASMLDAV